MADLSFDDLIPAPKSKGTRGERNFNPGNIEDGDFARSLPGYAGSDGRFAKFESMDHGYNAIESLLALKACLEPMAGRASIPLPGSSTAGRRRKMATRSANIPPSSGMAIRTRRWI
jgi:hypothetical protein